MKFGLVQSYCKKLLSKNYKKSGLETSSRPFCVSKDLMKFLRQIDCIGYLKLVSAILYQIFIFDHMIALQKL